MGVTVQKHLTGQVQSHFYFLIETQTEEKLYLKFGDVDFDEM